MNSTDRDMYENKRVVLITGDSSKWYEQAIFIIKKDAGRRALPSDLVKEAEGIIDDYMKTLAGTNAGCIRAAMLKNSESSNIIEMPLLSETKSLVSLPAEKKRKSMGRFVGLSMFAACAVVSVILIMRLF